MLCLQYILIGFIKNKMIAKLTLFQDVRSAVVNVFLLINEDLKLAAEVTRQEK